MWWQGGDESIKLCPPPLYPGPSREDLEGQQSGSCRAAPPHQGAGHWGKGRRVGSIMPCLGGAGGSAQRQKEVVPRSHPRSRPSERLPHLPLPRLQLVQLPLSLPSRSNSKEGEACVEVCMF